MSPSRGFNCLRYARLKFPPTWQIRRYSDFVQAATNPGNKSQIYVSRTHDPYINLSIEHYLLQTTPTDSTVLFVYINKPCIVIGRNQNPWVEANLGMLRNSGLEASLVRRRSGGGAVWHDLGNINYSVICPTADFHRDKHAEMVVRALKALGLDRTRVNERHDIVYDKFVATEADSNMASRGIFGDGDLIYKTYKISGSAYKLTRLRSLHHGTCIAWSPNIYAFSRYLRSPAKSAIVARGVESVNSPVTNLEIEPEEVENAVVSEFQHMYGAGEPVIVTEALTEVPKISAGVKELMSDYWIYNQTPQFTFSTEKVQREWGMPEMFDASFTARHGQINEVSLAFCDAVDSEINALATSLHGRNLHEITDWVEAFNQPAVNQRGAESNFNAAHLSKSSKSELAPLQLAGMAMNRLFGVGNYSLSEYIKPWGLRRKDYEALSRHGARNKVDQELIDEYALEYSSGKS